MSTNLEHDDLESCHSQKTCSTATSPLGPLQTSHLTFPSQSYPSPPARTVLKCYKFYKADPSPDEAATWACAERTELRMKQEQLCEMIHDRAEDYSARQQYKNLSRDQRAQVTQLTEDQRVEYPRMEWSCVYAKENYYANKARNPHRHDFETVSMIIILLGRPMEPTKYPRTPMGEYVDLRKHCQPHEGDMNHSRSSVAKIGLSGYYRVQAQHSAPKPVRRYLNQGSDSRRAGPPSVLTTQLDSGQLPVYDNGHDSANGLFSSDSQHDQRFTKPGEALSASGSYQMLSQLPCQHPQSSTGQNSRHSNGSPHYLPNLNVPSQKTTIARNPEFVFSSTTRKRGGDFEAPIPKRTCRPYGIQQVYDVQSQGVEDCTPWSEPS